MPLGWFALAILHTAVEKTTVPALTVVKEFCELTCFSWKSSADQQYLLIININLKSNPKELSMTQKKKVVKGFHLLCITSHLPKIMWL